MRPGVRIHDGRNGVLSSRWQTAWAWAKAYGTAEFWKTLPGLMSSLRGNPARVAAIIGGWLVIVALGIQNSDCQATTLPAASSPALTSTSVGGPLGSQPCSSWHPLHAHGPAQLARQEHRV